MSFIAAALIGGGTALLGGYMASNAAGDAAEAQSESANAATALQKQMFDKQNELNAPFRENGLTGQNRLMELLGIGGNAGAKGYGSASKNFSMSDFQEDPGYQFRMQQGQQALERSAAARGGLLSGRAGKDMTNYAQGAASQEYGNAFNRFQTNRSNQLNPLQSLSGQGQTATNQMTNDAGQFGVSAGQNMMGAGNARASGYVGSANAWGGALGQAATGYQQSQVLNQLFKPPSSGYSGASGYSPGADPLGGMISANGW